MNNSPGSGKRVDQFEMLHSRQQQQVADIPPRYGCRVMALADFVRHGCVTRPMYQGLGYSKGKQRRRRSARIPPRDLYRIAAKKNLNNPLTQMQIRAADEIHRTSERDGAFETKPCFGPQRMPGCESMSGRHPKRQLASGRKAHCRYPGQIQSIHRSYFGEKVHSRPDILEGPWPTASLFADASILDVPGGKAYCGERRTQMRVGFQAVGGAPPAPVDAHHHGKRAGTLWQPQVAELAGGYAITQTSIKGRVRSCQEVDGSFHSSITIRQGVAADNTPQKSAPAKECN